MTDKNKKTPHEILHEIFVKPFIDRKEKETTEENLVVEKQAEEKVEPKPKTAKKGNMKRGKK